MTVWQIKIRVRSSSSRMEWQKVHSPTPTQNSNLNLQLETPTKIPPDLRNSKSPSNESISRLSDYALSSAKITHKTIIPTNQKIHSRHDCGPSHESSGPEGILKRLSNSSLNFSHLVIITFYHKIQSTPTPILLIL